MPEKLNFTKRALDALKPRASGRYYVLDMGQPNLTFCVLPTGGKNFYWYGRQDGRPVRDKIGPYPDISIENARKGAAARNGDRARGISVRKKKDKGDTVAAAFERWLDKAKLRKKSWQADEANFRYHFGPIRNRRFSTLSREDVEKWHHAIGKKRGPVIANRCRALLSAMYGKSPTNPCLEVERYPEKSRERFLLADEMPRFMAAVKAQPQPWADFWQLALFTGARRGNVASMQWTELDLDRGIWHLPASKMKNGKPLSVVLPPPAIDILKARRDARKDEADFVFPAASETGHVLDPRKSWAKVVKAANLPDLRPHDLRRSLGSWQALAGTSLAIIGASLGHSDLKSTQVYARLLLDPVRSAVDGAVAAMIAAGEQELPAQPKADEPKPAVKKPRNKKGAKNAKA